jgi:hypothetical protein
MESDYDPNSAQACFARDKRLNLSDESDILYLRLVPDRLSVGSTGPVPTVLPVLNDATELLTMGTKKAAWRVENDESPGKLSCMPN